MARERRLEGTARLIEIAKEISKTSYNFPYWNLAKLLVKSLALAKIRHGTFKDQEKAILFAFYQMTL